MLARPAATDPELFAILISPTLMLSPQPRDHVSLAKEVAVVLGEQALVPQKARVRKRRRKRKMEIVVREDDGDLELKQKRLWFYA